MNHNIEIGRQVYAEHFQKVIEEQHNESFHQHHIPEIKHSKFTFRLAAGMLFSNPKHRSGQQQLQIYIDFLK